MHVLCLLAHRGPSKIHFLKPRILRAQASVGRGPSPFSHSGAPLASQGPYLQHVLPGARQFRPRGARPQLVRMEPVGVGAGNGQFEGFVGKTQARRRVLQQQSAPPLSLSPLLIRRIRSHLQRTLGGLVSLGLLYRLSRPGWMTHLVS